jgi:4-amino-4-deoxy-L-arabinose transferase-like glycosyltransferase
MTSAHIAHVASPAPRTRRAKARAIAGEQIAVAGGQLASGVGNLVFSLVLARLLAPTAFADMAAFLALYLVVHVPAGSLSAGSALSPELAERGRRRMLALGAGVGVAIAALAVPLASVLNVPVEMLLALALSAPCAPLLALDRGRLYGLGKRQRAIASLLAEPAVRLTAGVALAATIGATGGAVAVVAAGYAALLVARLPRRSAERPATPQFRDSATPGRAAAASDATDERAQPTPRSTPTILAFLGLALAQNQDILFAKGMLEAGDAARFAVLSTLGGVAAFATTTVPLVLLPRAKSRDQGALAAALGVAVALGAAAVAVVAIGGADLVTAMFGDRYASVAPIAAPYIGAMALLGIARVFVADACARGRERAALAAVGIGVVTQAIAIVALGDDPAGVATGTLVGMVALTLTAAGVTVTPLRRHRDNQHEPGPSPALRTLHSALPSSNRRFGLAITGITVGGLIIRLAATRGLWLDEAISVHQAQMPLGEMLDNLRTFDVHPPLHHVVTWAFVHVFGTAEYVVRAPSIIAGTLLIPVLYAAGRDLYDQRTGVVAAIFAAVAPFAIWYSQEARMYSLFMLFATVAVWMQVRAVRDGRKRDWVFYALASAALVWTQYFAALFVGVQQLAFLAYIVKRRTDRAPVRPLLIGWIASGALIVLLLAPLVPFALDQFAANEQAGKGFQQVPSQAGSDAGQEAGPSIYGAITNFVWAVWGYHSNGTMTSVSALWPFGMLLTLLLLGRGKSGTTRLVVACALVPAIALFGLGQLKPFVFEVRYFIAAVPLLLLLVARMVTSWAPTRVAMIIATTVAAITLALGSADQQLNGTNPRVYDFKGALAEIESRAQPGDVVIYSPPYLDKVLAYYGDDLNARPLDENPPSRKEARRVFVVGSFLDKPQYANATGSVVGRLKHERKLVDQFERPQIRVWEFR